MVNKKIMIVDDDEIYQFTSKIQFKYLIDVSTNLLSYTNPVAALNYLKDNQNDPGKMPDIVLLDINMPLMDGFEFLEFFTESIKYKKLMIFMVSSSIDQRDIARALNFAVVKGYLNKPLDVDKLQELIKNHEH